MGLHVIELSDAQQDRLYMLAHIWNYSIDRVVGILIDVASQTQLTIEQWLESAAFEECIQAAMEHDESDDA